MLFAPFKRTQRKQNNREERAAKLNQRDFEGNLSDDESDQDEDEYRELVKADRNIDLMDEFPEDREFKVENIRVSFLILFKRGLSKEIGKLH